MTGPAPDVSSKFRVDADPAEQALQNLMNAFKDLVTRQKEVNKAGRETKSTYQGVAQVLSDVASVVGVSKLTEFTKGQLEAADALGKLAQKTGVAVETLSVLGFAGQKAGRDLGDLETDFSRLSNSLDDLQRGSPETVRAFRQIGLSAKDLANLSPEQAFLRIADAQQRYADGSQKLAAIQQIFGRSASQLLPLLHDLADGGFERARDRAEKLGLVLSGETAKAATEFNDTMTELKAQAGAVALTFAQQIIPAITTFADITSSMAANLNPQWKTLLTNISGVSIVLLGVSSAARLAYPALKQLFLLILANPEIAAGLILLGVIVTKLNDIKRAADEARRSYGDFLNSLTTQGDVTTEINKLLAERAALDKQIADQRQKITDLGKGGDAGTSAVRSAFKAELDRLEKARQLLTDKLSAAFKRSSDIFNANRDKLAGPNPADPELLTAQAEARRRAAQDALAINQAKNKAEEQQNEAAFAEGLKGLKDYFDTRRELTERATAQEIAALQAQRRAVAATPLKNDLDPAEQAKRASDLASIDAQITARRVEGRLQLAKLDADEREKALSLATERLQYEQKIQEAKGNTAALAIAGIENEVAAFDKLLRQQGVADAEREAKLAEFRQSQTQKVTFDTDLAAGGREFDAIGRVREQLQDQVDTGLLTQREAEERLADLENQRLPVLRQMAQQLLASAEALGPDAVANAEAFAQQVETMAASADLAHQRTAQLLATLQQGIGSDLTNFLTDTALHVTEIGEALVGLIQSVAETIVQTFAQDLGNEVADAIFRGIRSGGEDGLSALGTAQVVAGATLTKSAAGDLDRAGNKVVIAGGVISAAASSLSKAADKLFEAAIALASVPQTGGDGGTSVGQVLGTAATIATIAFADGGVVPGAGSGDTVHAMMTPGEGVLTTGEMAKLGGPTGFARLRAMLGTVGFATPQISRGVQRFSAGGVVRAAPAAPAAASLNGRIDIALEPGLISRGLDSDEATSALIRVLGNNRRDVLAALEID